MELPLPRDIRSGWIQRHSLINVRFFLRFSGSYADWLKTEWGREYNRLHPGLTPLISFEGGIGNITPSSIDTTGGLGGLGGFGLSGTRVGMSGEVERARLDILERMKRTTDSRAKSRLTLPKLFGDGKKETNILADVL